MLMGQFSVAALAASPIWAEVAKDPPLSARKALKFANELKSSSASLLSEKIAIRSLPKRGVNSPFAVILASSEHGKAIWYTYAYG